MFKMSIPEISNEELLKRYERIKPVVTKNGKLYYFKEFSEGEIKTKSFLWNVDKDISEEIKEGTLVALEGEDFPCLHTYGYYGFFKPTIAEVLAQIPDGELFSVAAFEIIDGPETADDFYKDNLSTMAFANYFHVSTVRLYRKED